MQSTENFPEKVADIRDLLTVVYQWPNRAFKEMNVFAKVCLPGEMILGHKRKTNFLKNKTLLKLPHLQHLPETFRGKYKISSQNLRQLSDAEHNSKIPGTQDDSSQICLDSYFNISQPVNISQEYLYNSFMFRVWFYLSNCKSQKKKRDS